MTVRRAAGATAALALAALLAGAAAAQLLQPDAGYRDAQFQLRAALRDTLGHGDDVARLDTLGIALLRLGRLDDAASVFRRARDRAPGDPAACAGLGKLALFAGRLAEAESLLGVAVAADRDREWVADLYAARARQGAWAAAAPLAEELGDPGRAEMLRMMDGITPLRLAAGPGEVRIPWSRAYPVPIVRVRLNGRLVLMAIDTGVRDVLLDPSAVRRASVQSFPSRTLVSWLGTRTSAGNAIVQRLELGPMRLEDVPAAVVSLRKWSIEVNPRGEPLAGVIGLGVLRAFTPTLDYVGQALVLRRPGGGYAAGPGAQRVPFSVWGESDLTVWGHVGGGRRMALTVHSGVPGCGLAAPAEVFLELGIKPGTMSRIMKGAGAWLGGRSWTHVSVPAVSVGPVTSGKLDAWAGALEPAELWRHGVRRDALLSHDFFRGWRVTYDWDGQQLVFEPR